MKIPFILTAVAAVAAGILPILGPSSLHGAILPPGFTEDRVASGLNRPTHLTYSQGDGRLFICEKNGKVRIVKNGALLPTPFLSLNVHTGGDCGLLSVVVDGSPSVYVYYTATTPTIHNRVSRFTVSSNPDIVTPGSETVLLDLPTLVSTTNIGGAMVKQNEIYISTG